MRASAGSFRASIASCRNKSLSTVARSQKNCEWRCIPASISRGAFEKFVDQGLVRLGLFCSQAAKPRRQIKTGCSKQRALGIAGRRLRSGHGMPWLYEQSPNRTAAGRRRYAIFLRLTGVGRSRGCGRGHYGHHRGCGERGQAELGDDYVCGWDCVGVQVVPCCQIFV